MTGKLHVALLALAGQRSMLQPAECLLLLAVKHVDERLLPDVSQLVFRKDEVVAGIHIAVVFNAADARLTLVNANLPYTAEPTPLLDIADEATGQQLEAEAAMQYRSMAAAAQADDISLTLVAGYQDADTRQAAYEARVQTYRDKRKSEEKAARLAATIQPAANANEHGTGYAADILSADNPQQDTSFAETRAYEWLTAYAAEYGFILRYPQDRQAATGIVFEPWHWRYVGVENALAIRASGLSLEEFIALQRAD